LKCRSEIMKIRLAVALIALAIGFAVALNVRIWKLEKSLAALAGVGSITWIKPRPL